MSAVQHILDAQMVPDALRQFSLMRRQDDLAFFVGCGSQAAAAGIQAQIVSPPLGLGVLGGWSLGRRLDVTRPICAWSVSSARAAVFAAGGGAVSLRLTQMPTASDQAWIASAARRGELSVVVAGERARRRMTRAGAADGALSIVPPAAEAIDDVRARRDRTRQELGWTDGERVIVSPGPVLCGPSQRLAVWVHAMLRRFRPDVRLLVGGCGPGLDTVISFSRESGFDGEHRLTAGAIRPMDILSCADVVMILPERDEGLSTLAAAMRCGATIVSVSRPEVRDWVTDGHSAMLVSPGRARQAATAVNRLLDDTGFAARLGAAAARAAECFDAGDVRATLQAALSRTAAPETAHETG